MSGNINIESEYFVDQFVQKCRELKHIDAFAGISMASNTERPVSKVDLDKFREGSRRAAAWHAETFNQSQSQ